MKKKLVSIVICTLLFAAVPALQATHQNSDVNDIIKAEPQTGTRAPGDILIQFDAQTAHGETGSLGAEWDGQYFWSTARGLVNPPHKLFKWDIDGNLIATYNQPTQSSAWGMRDMTSDGTYLYSGSENGFWKIDPATGTTTLMFSNLAPMTIIRAVAWVPTEQMFYTGSFSLGWYKFSPDGSQKIAITNPGLSGVYGMTYDKINDTIWVFDQGSGGTDAKFYEYDYTSGVLTGKTWVVPMLSGLTGQIAGGCFYTTECISGKAVLGGMVQGDPVDKIFVMELGTTFYPPDTPDAPDGPDAGFINIEYDFTASTTHPDGYGIYYWFDWDDGTNSGWLGPYTSGATVTATHKWTAVGSYNITVKAKDDVNDAESGWSPAHTITISEPQLPILNIDWIRGGLFKVSALIKNIGPVTANNVQWTITLTGGAFIGKETTGTITTLEPGASETVKSKFVLGFGATVVNVTATIPESTATKEQSGTVLLFIIKL
jgi:hypothetical protein